MLVKDFFNVPDKRSPATAHPILRLGTNTSSAISPRCRGGRGLCRASVAATTAANYPTFQTHARRPVGAGVANRTTRFGQARNWHRYSVQRPRAAHETTA